MLLNSTESNKKFMAIAISQAKLASQIGEIPVGAVVVKNNKLISYAFNKREKSQLVTSHAEIIAIELACKKLKNWRLSGCELFVTLQPCLMCLGAIKNSRIKKLIYGAPRPEKDGEFELEILREICFRNQIEIVSNIMNTESIDLLKNFFKNLRKI